MSYPERDHIFLEAVFSVFGDLLILKRGRNDDDIGLFATSQLDELTSDFPFRQKCAAFEQ